MLATSDDPTDDPLVAAVEGDVEVFRGSLDDVLDRFAAAVPEGCDTVVRLTGDCPVLDPEILDRHLSSSDRAEYVTNAVERTMPDGLDVELFPRRWLERAALEATEAFDREHVTPWIRRNATVHHVTQAVDLSELRWTLDTAVDYAFLVQLFDALEEPFGAEAIYRWMLSSGHAGAFAERIREHLDE